VEEAAKANAKTQGHGGQLLVIGIVSPELAGIATGIAAIAQLLIFASEGA
jgi:hypothetical protein